MDVILVTETGVILLNQEENNFYCIKNLNDVMQFEIDQKLFQYEPHFHYYLDPTPGD